ncbi:MAG TPA: hypothetical protein VNT53_01965 [Pseudolysinimonas sp.]|nr:hypothetical protein [Pseudolysinimonas sp.]
MIRFPKASTARLGVRVAATAGVALLIGAFAVAPPPLVGQATELDAYMLSNSQTVSVSHSVEITALDRGDYGATPGVASLVAGGTNYDWAKLVLLFAHMPMTDDNVTVFTRWMRQENGADNWFNRNNPLNNGFGAPGAGGTGTNPNLVVAAQNVAKAFDKIGGYAGFVDAFRRGAPTAEIEAAIWASPWATSHYANGTHWHYTPVDVVKAPASAWG